MECAVDGCPHPADPKGVAGLCSGHSKRKQRGQVVNEPLASRATPGEVLLEAALALADAEEDVDFERAKARLKMATYAYARQGAVKAWRASMGERQAKGLPIGRPPKVSSLSADEAATAQRLANRQLAQRLGVSLCTVVRLRARLGKLR